MSIFIAVIIFCVIVVIHEFGHFIAARKNGILVEEFAIGMGPKLAGIKRGDTLYSIRLFPIGGFCKMLGEDEEDDDPRSFNSKKVWQRIVVITAGVFLNVILALVISCFCILFDGVGVPVIKTVMDGYPAQEAGLQSGDRIVKINDTKVNIYSDVSFAMEGSNGSDVLLTVKRGRQTLTYTIAPKLSELYDGSQGYLMGFNWDYHTAFFGETVEGYKKAGFVESMQAGFYTSVFYVKSTFLGFVRMITMQLKIDQMAGPIGIVSMIGDTYTEAVETSGIAVAIRTMLKFMALLSANLAVVNLLPLPALDGGRLVFLIIEGIRRRPVDPNKEGFIHFVGFVLLMIFAVFIAYNDIIKII